MTEWFLKRMLVFLPAIVAQLTPTIREGLEKLLKSLYSQALATDNPLDDAALELLASILQIDLEAIEAAA